MADKTTPRSGETATPATMRAHHPLMTLRDEVDRLFDSFFPGTFRPSTFGRSLFDVDPWRDRALQSMGDITPHMDVTECANRYDISVELPGMEEKDVTVKVQGDMLSIAGEKKAERREETGAAHLSERSYGSFVRAIRLPDDADADAVSADFAKGVLTVSVPKRPEGKNEKKIEVTTH